MAYVCNCTNCGHEFKHEQDITGFQVTCEDCNTKFFVQECTEISDQINTQSQSNEKDLADSKPKDDSTDREENFLEEDTSSETSTNLPKKKLSKKIFIFIALGSLFLFALIITVFFLIFYIPPPTMVSLEKASKSFAKQIYLYDRFKMYDKGLNTLKIKTDIIAEDLMKKDGMSVIPLERGVIITQNDIITNFDTILDIKKEDSSVIYSHVGIVKLKKTPRHRMAKYKSSPLYIITPKDWEPLQTNSYSQIDNELNNYSLKDQEDQSTANFKGFISNYKYSSEGRLRANYCLRFSNFIEPFQFVISGAKMKLKNTPWINSTPDYITLRLKWNHKKKAWVYEAKKSIDTTDTLKKLENLIGLNDDIKTTTNEEKRKWAGEKGLQQYKNGWIKKNDKEICENIEKGLVFFKGLWMTKKERQAQINLDSDTRAASFLQDEAAIKSLEKTLSNNSDAPNKEKTLSLLKKKRSILSEKKARKSRIEKEKARIAKERIEIDKKLVELKKQAKIYCENQITIKDLFKKYNLPFPLPKTKITHKEFSRLINNSVNKDIKNQIPDFDRKGIEQKAKKMYPLWKKGEEVEVKDSQGRTFKGVIFSLKEHQIGIGSSYVNAPDYSERMKIHIIPKINKKTIEDYVLKAEHKYNRNKDLLRKKLKNKYYDQYVKEYNFYKLTGSKSLMTDKEILNDLQNERHNKIQDLIQKVFIELIKKEGYVFYNNKWVSEKTRKTLIQGF